MSSIGILRQKELFQFYRSEGTQAKGVDQVHLIQNMCLPGQTPLLMALLLS